MVDVAVQMRSPAPRQTWEELLAADPTATVYQTPAWLDAICAVGPYQDASRLFETPNGRQFVLPMVRRAWLPRLQVVASPPKLWGSGGLVAPESTTADDVRAVWANLSTQPVIYGQIRPYYLTAAAWEAVSVPAGVTVGRKVTHVLDLDGGV